MTQIKVEVCNKDIWLSQSPFQALVFPVDEAPELVRQLQSLIRAHTIQTQNEDQPNA